MYGVHRHILTMVHGEKVVESNLNKFFEARQTPSQPDLSIEFDDIYPPACHDDALLFVAKKAYIRAPGDGSPCTASEEA